MFWTHNKEFLSKNYFQQILEVQNEISESCVPVKGRLNIDT